MGLHILKQPLSLSRCSYNDKIRSDDTGHPDQKVF